MSHDADLINAYRTQLQKIREAFEAFSLQRNHMAYHHPNERIAYGLLGDAIDSTEVSETENIYISKEPPLLLPDITRRPGEPLYNPSPMINGLRYINRTPHRED